MEILDGYQLGSDSFFELRHDNNDIACFLPFSWVDKKDGNEDSILKPANSKRC